jgi:hypothetical protein
MDNKNQNITPPLPKGGSRGDPDNNGRKSPCETEAPLVVESQAHFAIFPFGLFRFPLLIPIPPPDKGKKDV